MSRLSPRKTVWFLQFISLIFISMESDDSFIAGRFRSAKCMRNPNHPKRSPNPSSSGQMSQRARFLPRRQAQGGVLGFVFVGDILGSVGRFWDSGRCGSRRRCWQSRKILGFAATFL